MRKILLLALIVFTCQSLWAQKTGRARIDSFLHVYNTSKSDSNKVRALNQITAESINIGKPDSGIYYAHVAIDLSKKINYTLGEANAYHALGRAYGAKSNPTEAVKFFELAFVFYDKIKHVTSIAENYYSMGLVQQRINYDVALETFKKALQAAQQTTDKNLMGKCSYVIATCYIRMAAYDDAIKYTDLSKKYYKESGNEMGLANCNIASARINHRRGDIQQALKDNYAALKHYEKVGEYTGMYNAYTGFGLLYEDQKNWTEALNSYMSSKVAAEKVGNKITLNGAYINIGNAYRELGKTEESLKAFEEAFKLAQQTADKKGLATSKGNIATIYSIMGRNEEAIKYHEEAMALFEQIGAREMVGISFFEMGSAYFDMNKKELSREFLQKALQNAKQYHNREIISKSYELLTYIDTANKDFASALNNYRLYIQYRDSLSNAEQEKQLLTHKLTYEFSKKEDSLRMEQALVTEQLEKQTLLTKQQQQELKLQQASLVLAQKEKDVQMLRFLKTQAELQLSNEQKSKQLTIAEQEKALQQSALEKQALQNEQTLLLKDKALSTQRVQRNFWIAGAIALLLFSFFIFSNYYNQRKANSKLKSQQRKTEDALKELKATQTQLIQSEKMASLGELTAGIAHEIQNPLNFVNNFSELNDEILDEIRLDIKTGKFDSAVALIESLKTNNLKIHHHGKRADGIIKGMLLHSRGNNRDITPTDVNALADEFLRLSYHGLRARDKDFNATFVTHFDERLGMIEAVQQDIGRVLLNLFNNAFYAVNEKSKTMPKSFEPRVSVTTKKLGSMVEVTVRDNGNGIPEKVMSKIYQPFFTTKPTGQGTGLGLSISYDIVKTHDGTMTVDTREGEYTEFTVQLPVVAKEQKAKENALDTLEVGTV